MQEFLNRIEASENYVYLGIITLFNNLLTCDTVIFPTFVNEMVWWHAGWDWEKISQLLARLESGCVESFFFDNFF